MALKYFVVSLALLIAPLAQAAEELSSLTEMDYKAVEGKIRVRLNKEKIDTTPQKVAALTLSQISFNLNHKKSDSHPGGMTSILRMKPDNLRVLVEDLKVEMSVADMKHIFEEHGILVLRPPKKKSPTIIVGCGCVTRAYNNTTYTKGMWGDGRRPDKGLVKGYRQHHQHYDALTIDPNIVMNPSVLGYFPLNDVMKYLYKYYPGSITEIRTEGLKAMDSDEIKLYKPLLAKGAIVSIYSGTQVHIEPTATEEAVYTNGKNIEIEDDSLFEELWNWIGKVTKDDKARKDKKTGEEPSPVAMIFPGSVVRDAIAKSDLLAEHHNYCKKLIRNKIASKFPLAKHGFRFHRASIYRLIRKKGSFKLSLGYALEFKQLG